MRSSADRIKGDLETLGEIGKTEAGGVSRFIFTDEDFEARRFITGLMQSVGLRTVTDKVGNIIGRRPGRNEDLPPVMTGSHIDTVPNAGIFDGCVGVVGAIEAMRVLNANGVTSNRPIEVVVFNNEEGVRFEPLAGSKAMACQASVDSILNSRDRDGALFREAFERGGQRIDGLPSPCRRGRVRAFVELHIEQGPILEKKGLDIGIVGAIFGIRQFLTSFRGVASHAGGTPMSMRKDAVLAAAKTVVAVDEITKRYGPPAVGTVGFVRVYPGVVNVIGEQSEVSVDVRDSDGSRLRSRSSEVKRRIKAIARATSTEFEIVDRLEIDPTAMSRRISRVIEVCAKRVGARYTHLDSGPYHDTMMMAKITKCGMIFVPSRDGASHSRKEFTEWRQIAKGVDVLSETLVALSK